MLHSTLTPETVFNPNTAPGSEPVSVIEADTPRLGEQEGYKRLISAQLHRQGLPLAHLADRVGIGRARLHKIIRQTSTLTDSLRDRLFAELGIDHARAKVSVALLGDHTAYDEQAVFVATESLKSFYCEVATCRKGAIEVQLRPAVIHEASRRAYELLLSHQARVIENWNSLQL